MNSGSKSSRGLTIEKLTSMLETRLEDEAAALAALVGGLGKGERWPEVWALLHEAAQRDDRTAELAFAYEEACQPKALKKLTTEQQVELLLQAGSFFSDGLGDADGAVAYLERAVALQPTHDEAFRRLELALVETADGAKLCELYAAAAAHRATREEQLHYLRRAIELVDVFADEAHRALPIYERLLKLDPGNAEVRRALETWYRRAGRLGELAKLLEQALGQEGVSDAETRGKLLGLYLGELQQADRAIGHVEELLRQEPASAAGREAGQKLLAHKMLGARAALALEAAYEATGEVGEVVRTLGALIDAARGQQKIDAQKRLGRALLRQGSDAEAFAVLEKAVALDAGDDETRGALRQAGRAVDRQGDVVKVLLRSATTTKDPTLRARLNLEAAQLLLEQGDKKRARGVLQAAAEGEGPVALEALRSLDVLATEAGEVRALVEVLPRLAKMEPEAGARGRAAVRLAEAWQELGERRQAVEAWRALLDGETRERAEAALEKLYEQTEAWGDLVALLEGQGARLDGDAARGPLERAAEVRLGKLGDLPGALEAWRRIKERLGPSRQANARRLAALEQAGRPGDVIEVLLEEIDLAPASERGALWGRVARLRLDALKDVAGALRACEQGLTAEPGEASCGAIAAKLLEQGEHRLAAADALLPLYRKQADFWGLVRALEARGACAASVDERLAALDEAVQLVAGDDPVRALGLAAGALRLAVEGKVDAVADWLVHLELLSAAAEGPAAHAALLLAALGDRALDHPALIDLARRAAEALLDGGRSAEALSLLERVFRASPALISVAAAADRALSGRGEQRERVTLWRLVLEHEKAPARRVEMLRTIAGIERQLGGPGEAGAAPLREALLLAPDDRAAREGLVESLRASGQRAELFEQLGVLVERIEGEAMLRAVEELASLAVQLGKDEQAARWFREALDRGGRVPLADAERVAEALADRPLLRRVLEERVQAASGDEERAGLLERLAGLLEGDPARGEAWKQAAAARVRLGQPAEAARLFRLALALRGDDGEILDQLLALERAAGDAPAQIELLRRKLMLCAGAEAEVEVLLAMARLAEQTRSVAVLLASIEGARFSWPPAGRQLVLEAKARALAADATQADAAAEAFRAQIEATRSAAMVDAFEGFLAAAPPGEARLRDRRWLLAWRADNAAEPGPALLAWASAEETLLGDKAAAIDIYRRVLVLDPSSEIALGRLGPLLLDVGDLEGARGALLARRARSEGAARRLLDLELAALLCDRLRRPDEALSALWPVLEARPDDPDAIEIVGRVLALSQGQDAVRRRAIEALERAAGGERAEELLTLLLAMPVEGDPKEARKGWYESLLRRLEGRPELALDAALRAAREQPLEESFWDHAERLARQLDRPKAVVDAYRERIEDSSVASAIGQRAIDFYEEWFEDPEGVVGLLERVLLADPGAQWAVDRLKVSYGASERWGELLALYDRMVEGARSDEDRVVFLEDAVQVAKDFAADDARAIRYLERLVSLRPGDARLQGALERLYERTGNHRALIDLLVRQVPRLDPPTAQLQRARVAALWLDAVGDVGQAFGEVERMLALDAEHPEALALLERILGTYQRPAAAGARPSQVASAYQRAAGLLKSRYQEAGRYADLVRVLEVELEAAATADRAKLLRQIVELRLQKTGDLAGAFEDVAALLALEPQSAVHLASLEDLAERLSNHGRHAEVLAHVAAEQSGSAAALLWLEAARVARDRLSDEPRATLGFRRALAEGKAAGGDAPLALVSARELAALLIAPGREAERYDALGVVVDFEPDAEARRAALVAMAALAEGPLADPERAAQAWRRRLADDARDLAALGGLAAACELLGRWGELVDCLEQRAQVVEERDLRQADLVRVARVLSGRLGDVDRAVAAWTRVRETFGDVEDSVEATGALLEGAGRFDELARLLADRAGHAEPPARRAELLRWLGDVERQRRGQPASAVEAYRKSLAADPANQGACDGLGALLAEGPCRAEAAAVLLERHRRVGSWRGVISLLEPRVELAASDAERAAVLREAAGLLEREGDDDGALAALGRALRLTPDDQGLADEVLRVAGDARRLRGVEALEAAASASPSAARALWTRVALAQKPHDQAAAERAYALALDAGGDDVALLTSLVELQRLSRGAPLIASLLRLSAASGGDARLLQEAARVALDELHDAEQARSLAVRLVEQAGRSGEFFEAPVDWALSVLVSDGPASADAAQQVALLARAVALPFPPERRVEMRRQSARIAERRLGDLDGAIQSYRTILEQNPADLDAMEQLAQLYRRLGRRGDLLDIRRRQIAAQTSGAPRAALRVDLAKLLRDTGDIEGAVEALRAALSDAPDHAEGVGLLEQLYEVAGRHRELLQLLEQQAARRESEQDLSAVELWARVASLAEGRLGDLPRAVAAHRKAAALGREASLEALARLLVQQREHAAAAEVLERLLAHAGDDALATTCLRLAEAYVADGRRDDARRVLEQTADRAPDPDPIRARLAELYREAGDWGRLADLMAVEAAQARDPRVRATRLREAAELLLSRKNDAAAAAPLLAQAVELAPDDALVQLAFCESLRQVGRLDEASAALRRLIDSYGSRRPKDRAQAHFQLGLVLGATGDRAGAIAELDAATKIDPAQPRFFHALGSIAFDAGEFERAQRALRALLLLLPRAARSDQVVPRVEVLLGLAAIASKQSDTVRASEFFESAFAYARENESEQAALEQGLRARGQHALLARALSSRLAASSDEQAVPLLLELAALYNQHLDRRGEAFELLLRAVSLALGDPDIRARAFETARSLGKLTVLLEELSRLASGESTALSTGERFALWIELARVADVELRDVPRAVAALEQAERLAPLLPDPLASLRSVWSPLEGLLRRAGDPQPLASLLARKAAAEASHGAAPALRADPVYGLAELLLSNLATLDEGATYLDQALAIDPQIDRAAALIDRALAAHPDEERALRVYERFSRAQGRKHALVDALKRLGALPSCGTAPLREAAEIAMELGEGPTAEAILREISELDQSPASSADVIWALTTLADRLQARGDLSLAASLKERAAEMADPATRDRLLLEVAALARGPLLDPPRAARLYAAVLDANPGSAEAWRPLADIHRETGDDARLAPLLEAILPLVGDAERGALRAELVAVLLRSSSEEALHRAAQLLRDALADDPADLSAASQLTGLLERLGNVALLIEHLERQLDGARDRNDGGSILGLAARLGALYAQQNQERRAVEVYRAGLDWAPRDVGLLRALLAIIEKRDDAFETTDVLERLLAAEQGEQAAAVALRLAALHDANWNSDAAERALELGYQAHPDPQIRDQLAERYTDAAAWPKLAALLERDAAARDVASGKVDALKRAADVQRKHLNNAAAAADLLQQALTLAPTDRPLLLALLDVLAATPAPHAARRSIEVLSFALERRPGDVELLRLRGAAHASLGSFDLALADLERCVSLGGDRFAPALVAALQQAIPQTRGNAALRPLRLRLAQLLSASGDHDAAREQLEAALRAEPSSADLLRALADLERTCGRWDAVLAPLKTLLLGLDGEPLVALAIELADAADAAGKPAEARSALERALRAAPQNASLRKRVRALYARVGAHRELAALLREDAAQTSEVGPRFEALLGAARLLLDPQLGDLKAATQILDEARALRPDDLELAVLFADTQIALKRPREAITALEKATLAHRGKRSKMLGQVYLRKATIEQGLGELPAGLQSLSKAFENDGSNGPLAMKMGRLALELNDENTATRAFRAITLMKPAASPGDDGTSAVDKAQAYYQLSLLALGQADRRKARLLAEKAVVEDPSLDAARQLRDELKNS